MPIVTDFTELRDGMTAAEALHVFVEYCNKQNTLFITERWFRPYREQLQAALPSIINTNHVEALREALLESVHLKTVVAWLTESGINGWDDFKKDKERKKEAAELEAIRRGLFPWEDVDACRTKAQSGADAELPPAPAYYRLTPKYPVEALRSGAKPCPFCGAQFDDLGKVYFVSPDWTWEKLCGRAGWLTICDNCHVQVQFFCQVMN